LDAFVGDRMHTLGGTPEYYAPELLKTEQRGPLGKALDWWCVGVLVFEMFNKATPFQKLPRSNSGIDARKLVVGTWVQPWVEFPGLPSTARNFVEGLLSPDPTQRLGSGGSVEVMQHPYFEEVGQENWAQLESRAVPPPWRPSDKEDNFEEIQSQRYHNSSKVMSPDQLVGIDGRAETRRLSEMAPELEGWAFSRRGTEPSMMLGEAIPSSAANHTAPAEDSWKASSNRQSGSNQYQFGDVTRSVLNKVGSKIGLFK